MDVAGIRREFERLRRRLFGLGFGSVVIRGRLQLIVTQRTGREVTQEMQRRTFVTSDAACDADVGEAERELGGDPELSDNGDCSRQQNM